MLSDGEWARIEPLLPSSAGRRGHPYRDHRQVVEGIVYRQRFQIPWRELPAEFGPWQTVWKQHHRLCADGTLSQILARLQAETERVAAAARPASCPEDPAAASVDPSRAVRSSHRALTARR